MGSLNDLNTVHGGEATVHSDANGPVIQRLIGLLEDIEEGDLAWEWSPRTDADEVAASGVSVPLTGISFSSELNVDRNLTYIDVRIVAGGGS